MSTLRARPRHWNLHQNSVKDAGRSSEIRQDPKPWLTAAGFLGGPAFGMMNPPRVKSARLGNTAAGSVITHTNPILRIVSPWRPDLLAHMVPATPDESTCVVLTGMWKRVGRADRNRGDQLGGRPLRVSQSCLADFSQPRSPQCACSQSSCRHRCHRARRKPPRAAHIRSTLA